jgi:hypothetical protein
MNLRSASRSILQAKAIQTTAVAPSILRRDGATATPNRVQWLNVVTVQLIDLGVGMREVDDNVFVSTGHEVQCFHCKRRKMKCRCDRQSIRNEIQGMRVVCVEPATYHHAKTNNLATDLIINTDEVEPTRFTSRTILQAPANQTTADAPVAVARLSHPSLNDTDDYLTTGTDELERVGYGVEEEVEEASDEDNEEVESIDVDGADEEVAAIDAPIARSVVIQDSPETYDFVEIPSCRDINDPSYQFYRNSLRDYQMVKKEGKAYRKKVNKIRNNWQKRENLCMLSSENKRLVRLPKSEFILTFPEVDDLDRFKLACKADKASWLADQRMLDDDEDEFDSNDLDLTIHTNDVEPIGNEAEENVDGEDDDEDEFDSNDLDLTVHTNDAEPIGNEAEENVDVKDEGAVQCKRLRMLKVR